MESVSAVPGSFGFLVQSGSGRFEQPALACTLPVCHFAGLPRSPAPLPLACTRPVCHSRMEQPLVSRTTWPGRGWTRVSSGRGSHASGAQPGTWFTWVAGWLRVACPGVHPPGVPLASHVPSVCASLVPAPGTPRSCCRERGHPVVWTTPALARIRPHCRLGLLDCAPIRSCGDVPGCRVAKWIPHTESLRSAGPWPIVSAPGWSRCQEPWQTTG